MNIRASLKTVLLVLAQQPTALLLGALLLLHFGLPVAHAAEAAGTAPSATPAAPATPPPLTHRPLRTNQPPAPPTPTEPQVFDGYAGAIPFSVIPRKPSLTMYPCTMCHGAMKPNPTPRKLVAAPHVSDLQHGRGRIWCLNCHSLDSRDQLQNLRGEKVDFDRSDLICGQCHFDRHRDWHYGGHGKRDANWTGERKLYACTHCHDPHSPALKPRDPQAPPPVRAGLSRPPTEHSEKQ